MRAKVSPPVAIVALLALAVVLSGCTGDPGPAATDPLPLHNPPEGLTHLEAEPAPPLATTTIDGDEWSLAAQTGKVVLVEFMGAGCSSCLRNLPEHKKMYAELEAEPGFVFVGLSIWPENDEILRDYRDEHEIWWPLAMAPDGARSAYDLRSTPTHVFIAHNGQLHARGSVLPAASMLEEARFLLDARPDAATESAAGPADP